MELNSEQKNWLRENKAYYENTVINKLFCDVQFQARIKNAVNFSDFTDDGCAYVYAAFIHMLKLYEVASLPMPGVVTWELLKPYADAMNAEEALFDEEDVPRMIEVVSVCAAPLADTWGVVDAFLSAWLKDSRARKLSTMVRRETVVDARMFAENLQRDIQIADSLTEDKGLDSYDAALYGEDETIIMRISTGMPGLDTALNGGLAPKEAVFVIAGTGGGKSVVVCQISEYLLRSNRRACIVSTEQSMSAIKYILRIVSNRLNISIKKITDFKNLKGLRTYVAVNYPNKVDRLEEVIKEVVSKLFIYVETDPEQVKSAGDLLRKAFDAYVTKFGYPPEVMFFDWLGDIADNGVKNFESSSRSAAWEISAASAVRGCEDLDVALVVLAQACNQSKTLSILQQEDIAIGKGIIKKATSAVGFTNTMDKAAVRANAQDNNNSLDNVILKAQKICVMKSRNGVDGATYPIERDFGYQRFKST